MSTDNWREQQNCKLRTNQCSWRRGLTLFLPENQAHLFFKLHKNFPVKCLRTSLISASSAVRTRSLARPRPQRRPMPRYRICPAASLMLAPPHPPEIRKICYPLVIDLDSCCVQGCTESGAARSHPGQHHLLITQGSPRRHAGTCCPEANLTLKAAPRLSKHSTSRSEWGPAPATLSSGDLAPHITVKSALSPFSRRCSSFSKRGRIGG